MYKQTKAVLIRQAVSATSKEFLLPINHSLPGYYRRSPCELMQHFLEKYAKLYKSARKNVKDVM